MTVTVNGNTKLESAGEKGGVRTLKEIYFGWETGNVLQVPKDASQADILRAYSEAGF
jgi:hypothetical protein